MKRIDSIRKSPIYVNFDETLVGMTTVRAFRREAEFTRKNDSLVNDQMRAWYPIVISQRYLRLGACRVIQEGTNSSHSVTL